MSHLVTDGKLFGKFSVSDVVILGVTSVIAIYFLFKKFSKSDTSKRDFEFIRQASRDNSQDDRSYVKNLIKRNCRLLILYGSQTGTAEGFANCLKREADMYGIKALVCDPELHDMEDFPELKDINEVVCIFCVATYGEGEPTDNAQEMVSWLKETESDLSGISYTVFGLGNKTYESYNAIGKYFDKRLAELGAQRIYDLGLGNDDGIIEEDFTKWKNGLWKPLCNHFGLSGEVSRRRSREFRLSKHTIFPSDELFIGEVDKLGSLAVQRPPFDAKNPFMGKVIAHRELHSPNSDRSCMHIEVDISNSNMRFDAGDHVAVFPTNSPTLVEGLATKLEVDLDSVLHYVPIDDYDTSRMPFPTPCTYRTALTHYVDIAGCVKKNLLTELSEFTSDSAEEEMLRNLGSEESALYQSWILESRRHILAVLEDLPSIKIAADHLFELLPKLQVRYYSICTSSKVNKNLVGITAVLVEYTTDVGRHMTGVSTGYLRRKIPTKDNPTPSVPVYIRRSQFRLPYYPNVPVIMVGPGTGIAPFRGFLEERSMLKSSGKAIGEMILFFGCRKASEDFIYREELEVFKQNCVLTDLYVAFSRDQPEKIYVQHLMLQNSVKQKIWSLLQKGAHFYVCGDAQRMAGDVHAALSKIIETEGNRESSAAENYIKSMISKGRYCLDVWS